MKQSFLSKTSFGLNDQESQDYESFHFLENEMEDIDFSPSENIWKKFELIPTPPRSPRREDEDDTDILDMVDGIFSPKSTSERLHMVSEILEDPVSQTVDTPDFLECACSRCPNIKSKLLIQDCMWSGTDGDDKSDEKPVEKKTTFSSTDVNVNTECVDPSSVFPYPISDMSSSRDSLGVDTPSESGE